MTGNGSLRTVKITENPEMVGTRSVTASSIDAQDIHLNLNHAFCDRIQ